MSTKKYFKTEIAAQTNIKQTIKDEKEVRLAEQISPMMIGGAAATVALLNPIAGVIAAAISPPLAIMLTNLCQKRIERFQAALSRKGVELGSTAIEQMKGREEKLDLLREVISAALATSSEKKIKFLANVLVDGLKADQPVQILFANRIVRTIARIDDLEIIILAVLSTINNHSGGIGIADLMTKSEIGDANLLRSGLSVLAAEGLVYSEPTNKETFRVSDYGESLLVELKKAIGHITLPEIAIDENQRT